MRPEQSRYLGKDKDRTEPAPVPSVITPQDDERRANDLRDRTHEPAFASVTQSDPKQVAGSLLKMHRAIESLEVCAGRIEQLVMRKSQDENQGHDNRASVAPLTDGQTIAATLEWLAHRLNTTNDRMVQGIGRLNSLVI